MLNPISTTTKNALKGVALIFTAITAIASVSAISDYIDRKNAKAAEVKEFFRREALTPQQRIAEDRQREAKALAEANAAKAVAERSSLEAMRSAGSLACKAFLMQSLNDPFSAEIDPPHGSIGTDYSYSGVLEGRAKNAFGAYVKASWYCKAVRSGNAYNVVELTQFKP